MAKRLVKKSPAKGTVKQTERPPWPTCSTTGCKDSSVMQWTDRKGKKVHGCVKHRAEYERTSPEFKAALARFNKEQAERVKKNAQVSPKKKTITRKKVSK